MTRLYNTKKRHICECGNLASHRLRMRVLRPDLETSVHFTLYLCDQCYQLELLLHDEWLAEQRRFQFRRRRLRRGRRIG